MSDEEITEGEDALIEDDQESTEGSKAAKTFGRRATSNLRTAKRSLEVVAWQHDQRTRHLVAEANVLAMLELADAIRFARAAS